MCSTHIHTAQQSCRKDVENFQPRNYISLLCYGRGILSTFYLKCEVHFLFLPFSIFIIQYCPFPSRNCFYFFRFGSHFTSRPEDLHVLCKLIVFFLAKFSLYLSRLLYLRARNVKGYLSRMIGSILRYFPACFFFRSFLIDCILGVTIFSYGKTGLGESLKERLLIPILRGVSNFIRFSTCAS